jgi:hypothetical protein
MAFNTPLNCHLAKFTNSNRPSKLSPLGSMCLSRDFQSLVGKLQYACQLLVVGIPNGKSLIGPYFRPSKFLVFVLIIV